MHGGHSGGDRPEFTLGPVTEAEAGELAAQLRAVLELVELGDLPAEVDQVGFLRGAIAMAVVLAH